MPRSSNLNPINLFSTPRAFSASKALEFVNSLVNLVTQPKPASNGEVLSSMSFP